MAGWFVMSPYPYRQPDPRSPVAPHNSRLGARRVAALAAVLVGSLLLSGCTVGFWTYQQITAPEATYIQVNCDGRDGPPKLAYYPFHGVFLGVATGPLDLRLRTPRGVHAHLDGDAVVVSGHTDKGNLDVTLKLKTAAQASDAGSLAEARFEERHDTGWQPGVPTSDAQIDTMTTGTILLPPITIDGKTWPAQTLSFARKVYTQVMKPNATCSAP
jgi:hypothetical protein